MTNRSFCVYWRATSILLLSTVAIWPAFARAQDDLQSATMKAVIEARSARTAAEEALRKADEALAKAEALLARQPDLSPAEVAMPGRAMVAPTASSASASNGKVYAADRYMPTRINAVVGPVGEGVSPRDQPINRFAYECLRTYQLIGLQSRQCGIRRGHPEKRRRDRSYSILHCSQIGSSRELLEVFAQRFCRIRRRRHQSHGISRLQ